MLNVIAFVLGFGCGWGFWALFVRNGLESAAEYRGLRLAGGSRTYSIFKASLVFLFGARA